ncbi:MAG: transposase [Bryobacterales bacterium]|nr:transposase [Bryobacterales bacterium]
MPRPGRFAPAGVPLHVTQRGNFRSAVFRTDADRGLYMRLLGRYAIEYGNRVAGYCLMPNHVHLLLIPGHAAGVSGMMQALDATYARVSNERLERKGHLWEARFRSATMSQRHYRAALAYVDLNPVRAGMVREATEYPWSSAAAHAGLCAYPGFLDREEFSRLYAPEEWRETLRREVEAETIEELRRATRFGGVAGGTEFVKQMEIIYGRRLAPRPAGRPKNPANSRQTSVAR